MKNPTLKISRAGFFIAQKSPKNFPRVISSELTAIRDSVRSELSLNKETHDVVKASWASVRLEGVEPGFIDPKIINQTLYNFSDFIP